MKSSSRNGIEDLEVYSAAHAQQAIATKSVPRHHLEHSIFWYGRALMCCQLVIGSAFEIVDTIRSALILQGIVVQGGSTTGCWLTTVLGLAFLRLLHCE